MCICLCNLSADKALELIAQRGLEVTTATPDPCGFTADPVKARECLGALSEKLPKPIDLLVGDTNRRRTGLGIACHVWRGSLPKDAILALNEDVYVSAPEFTLLQQSSQLHQAVLCQMLGRYLGTWTPSENRPNGLEERAPLTTFDSLNEFLSEVGAARGTRNLRMAMEYTCDGAASAQETSLQLALSLPLELHGMGLVRPVMNYEVELSNAARRLYSHDSIRIDLCWRQARFGLEYQGQDHGMQLGDDYARWYAAHEERYDLWYVAKEQLENAVQMRYIGCEVAKRIGLDTNDLALPTEGELQDLLDILAGRKHPRPLSRGEQRRRRVEFKARCRGAK